MYTNDKIRKELETILDGIRNTPTMLDFFPIIKYSKRKFEELSNKCLELYQETEDIERKEESFELTQRLLSIESEYKSLRTRLMLIPSVMLIYTGFAIVMGLITFIDIPGFVNEVLMVEAPERLLTFGIAGAFIYLVTVALNNMRINEKGNDATTRIAETTIRILLAIVVPIILVALFFSPDGELLEFQISPELLAFICGYSAKLVVDVMNKLVDKVSIMINAI